MAEKKKMSVAEILAAARAKDGGGGSPAAPAEPPVADAESAVEAAALAKPKPAAAKPAAAKAAGGGRPSVADILAAARANKTEATPAAAAAEKPKPAAADKPKPAAKPAAAKPAAATAPKTGVQRDTASILAAARAGAKPGPVSKAEAPAVTAKLQAAAAKPKPVAAAAEKPAVVRAAPPMPERPAKPAAKKEGEEDRRGFLEIALGSFMAMGFTALSVTGGLFTLGLARFMFPNVLAEPPSRFKVGFKEGFPAGKVETKFVPQYGVWVVNGEFQGQQQIYALKTVCTHLGCTPNWLEAEQKFKCPCHGSGFYKDGVNFEGPAPRPLERYAIRISDDGQLEIDKSKAFQEELGQWADPDSYVNV
ncbi:MAG: ubiquinol-cytochrome c reductase iron-sulfur subunit [Planctomycetia bacterium]